MSKIVLTSLIISIIGLIYSFLSALLVERKKESDSRKQERNFNIAARSAEKLFGGVHQAVFFISLVIAVIFSLTSIGVKMAAAFLAGVIAAVIIEKIALRIIFSANSRMISEQDNPSANFSSIALNSAGVSGLLAISLSLLALSVSYGFLNNLNIAISFALGAALVFALSKISIGVFKKSIQNQSEFSILTSASHIMPAALNSIGIFQMFTAVIAASMIIGAMALAGANGAAAMLPLALASIIAAIAILNLIFVKLFAKRNIARASKIAFYISALIFAASSYWIVKKLIGTTILFWPILIGIALSFVVNISGNKDFMEKFKDYPAKAWLLLGYLILFFIALFSAFRFDGIYALSLSAAGLSGSLIILSLNNLYLNIIKAIRSADSAGFGVKNFVSAELENCSGNQAETGLNGIIAGMIVILLVLAAQLSGILNISLNTGRTLFALFAGALIAGAAIKFFENSSSELSGIIKDIDYSDIGKLKMSFRKILASVFGKSTHIVILALALPLIVLVVLGIHAFIALSAAMAAFLLALEDSDIASLAVLLILFVIAALPIII